ncbi:MAG: cation transporter [Clostridia bacterium]|nr:cation transporter [Clostridia bacterium]
MTNLILKLFVKNHTDTKNAKVREQVGKVASIVGIVVNLVLSLCKIAVGTLFGLISVMADGFNNLTDCGSNIVSLISFKLASRPADKEHPYGHARIEYVASMIVGFIVMLLAFELGMESVNKIVDLVNGNSTQVTFEVITVVVLGISILGKLWFYFFNSKLAKTYNAELLKATASDSLSDVFATTAVLVSVVISPVTGFNTDGIMGIVVAVLIAIAGVGILRDTLNHLLGASPTEELIKSIEERIRCFDGVLGIHDLHVHNYGPNKFYASVHVEVDSAVDVMESHDMIDEIERDFANNTDIMLVIHLDPIVIGDPELDTYRQEILAIVQQLDKAFDIHDFRMVKGPTHTNLIFDVAVSYDTKLTSTQIVEHIQQQISLAHPSVYVVPTVERKLS